MRVLVVDDDPAIRELLTEVLSLEGDVVHTAADGHAALEQVPAFQPEIILLDLVMPILNGWEFAHTYRQLPGAQAVVLAFTARDDLDAEPARVSADGMIRKPFDLGELLATLARYRSHHPRGCAA